MVKVTHVLTDEDMEALEDGGVVEFEPVTLTDRNGNRGTVRLVKDDAGGDGE